MLCQFLGSARFQLIVERKHWSRDFLVQVAYYTWTPWFRRKTKEKTIYSQACLFQDSLIHFWCAVLEYKIPRCFFKKRFSFSCSLLDALETFGTNQSYHYPTVAAGVIWSKSWNWNLYMNRWCLLNCVDLIDRANMIKSISNIS